MLFYKLIEKNSNNFEFDETNTTYILEKEKTIIGYGFLKSDSNNVIEIFIKEEYQSNGYGKYLFSKMHEVLKNENYKDIKLTIKKDNYRIKNIIIFYGGKQLYTTATEESYILPIK